MRNLLLVVLLAGCADSAGVADGALDLGADLPSRGLVSIAVSPSSASALVGEQVTFTATGTYSDGTTGDLTATAQWSSSSSAVAQIASGGVATVAAAGTTQITASQNGQTSAPVPLSARSVVSVQVSAPLDGGSFAITTAGGPPVQFTAVATLSDATTLDVTRHPLTVWSSSMTSIATVNGSGLALPGNSAGVSDISATLGGRTGMATLQVM